MCCVASHVYLKTLPTYAFPGFFLCISEEVFLCSVAQKQLFYIPYTWYLLYKDSALVSQIAQHVPTEAQFRPAASGKLGSSNGKEPALTGRVQEFKEGTDSKGSSTRGDLQ